MLDVPSRKFPLLNYLKNGSQLSTHFRCSDVMKSIWIKRNPFLVIKSAANIEKCLHLEMYI